jgi:hypothetical protein
MGFINAYSQTMNVKYKKITQSNKDLDYTISATYPQVDFGPDALMGVRGIAQDINDSFDDAVNGMISDFEKQVAEIPSEAVKGPSSLDITSEAWVSNESILSSELTVFSNVSGMAHPLTTISAYNYGADGAGPLTLQDLFKSNAGYLKFISETCIRELSDYASKEGVTNINDMITGGASPDAKNFTAWVIKDDNLKIIFNPYQVGPYVMGIQSVSIPLSNMTEMINPNGPLSFMYR